MREALIKLTHWHPGLHRMSVSQTMTTEETLTCLHVQLYHPDQGTQPLYNLLRLSHPQKMNAEDPIRLGRDGQTCTFVLNDIRVSRKQISICAYRKPGSTEMRFTIQNISQKCKILISGSELGYLERADLDDKALLRFGRYELLIWREPGEAQDCFEVLFEKQNIPPSRELGVDVPCRLAVLDTGVRNYHSGSLDSQEPQESDETL
ncbi:TRAF-interacting protein with FHA domain-containing protein A [Electrophorus electricus]|uniref:TRAF-interacting protein with FHA domain-containing protein A n=1 Tax=Electrophorus electricus TaxID=8005 RepID=A0AAY5EY34_ELEEL|nr:TRAF-interacting protein with FHA domain-containing protein A [Electrophorus electricus]